MVAMKVDGKKVVQSAPAMSPLRDRLGKQIAFRRTGFLLLEDGTGVYGCLEKGCSYTNARVGMVRQHLGIVHKPVKDPINVPAQSNGKHETTTVTPINPLDSVTLGELVKAYANRNNNQANANVAAENRKLTEQLNKAIKERDEHRKRANDAEATLKSIRNRLGIKD